MIASLLAFAFLAAIPSSDARHPTPEEMFAELKTGVLALPDGAAILDYVMCYAESRNADLRHALGLLPPEDLYPQFAEFRSQDENRIFRNLTPEEGAALQALISEEVGDRLGIVACQHTLVPSPEYLDRLADQARYMRAAMRGEVDPAADYRALVDQRLTIMANQPNGDQLLAINACYAFTPVVEQPEFGIDHTRLGIDPDQLDAAFDALDPLVNQLSMAGRLLDETEIWQAAVSDRVTVPTTEQCQGLFADYARSSWRYD